jgi:hypothetical protein
MEKGTQEDIKLLLYNLAKIPLFMLIVSGQGLIYHLPGLPRTTALRSRYYGLTYH